MVEACEKPSAPDATAGSGGGPSADAGAEAASDGDAKGAPDGDAALPDGDGASDSACNSVIIPLDAALDGDPSCLVSLPCGLPTGLTAVGCDIYLGPSPIGCFLVPEAGCYADAYAPGADGAVLIDCPACPAGGGRRPRGLLPPRAPRRACTPVGAYFARMAHDEAASVHAFRRMHEELAALGAPVPLLQAADRSARDEERHARMMTRLARRHGAPVPAPLVRRGRPRSLEAIARENAVEGCVFETFGALVAAWQGAHAPEASLRRAFQRIAADEARHAALAWAVARWAEARLDPGARARVWRARDRAVRALRARVPASRVDAAVGIPDPARRAALVEGFVRRLGLV
jgi:hypothetical protein